MPRYLIEHSFSEALDWGCDVGQRDRIRQAVDLATQNGMLWIHSYIAVDQQRAVTIAEARSAADIRAAMHSVGWPIDRITEIRVLDPQSLV